METKMKFRQILVLAGAVLAVSASVPGPYDPGYNGGTSQYYGANQGQYYSPQYAPVPYAPQPYYPTQRYVAVQPQYYYGGQAYYHGGWPRTGYDTDQSSR